MEIKCSTIPDQLKDMLRIQMYLGDQQHPEWRSQKFDFELAATEEVIEMLQHLKWHWWKNNKVTSADIDWESVYYEATDVFNFIASHILQDFSPERSLKCFIEGYKSTPQATTTIPRISHAIEHAKNLMSFLVSDKLFSNEDYVNSNSIENITTAYFSLLEEIHLDMDTLYAIYRAKAELNLFRWEHGFKDGTYVRMWNGQKDDEYLRKIVKMANPEDPNFTTFIRKGLENVYANVVAKRELDKVQKQIQAGSTSLSPAAALNQKTHVDNMTFTRAPRPGKERSESTSDFPPDDAA